MGCSVGGAPLGGGERERARARKKAAGPSVSPRDALWPSR